jgi:hypothetical protein
MAGGDRDRGSRLHFLSGAPARIVFSLPSSQVVVLLERKFGPGAMVMQGGAKVAERIQ